MILDLYLFGSMFLGIWDLFVVADGGLYSSNPVPDTVAGIPA